MPLPQIEHDTIYVFQLDAMLRQQARDEGWYMYNFGRYGGIGIGRYGDRFVNDYTAAEFVRCCAVLGSLFHQRAIRFHDS